MKDIIGYEGQYSITKNGEVYSTPKDGKKPKFLKPEILDHNQHTSYKRVTLCKDGKTKRFMVHRLVAKAFIPNPEDKPQVNHIDNNGLNNVVENLEWTTGSENMQHCIKQRRHLKGTIAGGKAAGVIRKQKFLKKAKEEIGNTYGDLTVVDILLDQGKANRTKFVCTCACGNPNYVMREKSHLLKSTNLHCAKCAQQLRRKNK